MLCFVVIWMNGGPKAEKNQNQYFSKFIRSCLQNCVWRTAEVDVFHSGFKCGGTLRGFAGMQLSRSPGRSGVSNTKITITNKVPRMFLLVQKVFSSVHFSQSLSCVRLFATPWTAAQQASMSITNSKSLLKLMSTESVMPSNHLILCHPLLLPSIFPSIRVFSSESVLQISGQSIGSFSISISLSNEHPGLISFRMDWLDLLAVQGTLESLQLHSSKASILQYSAFLIVPLSQPYNYWKNHSFDYTYLCGQSNVSAF